MNEIEKRFGWRLEKVVSLIKKKNYKDAFSEYTLLIKLFNRLHGYEDTERIDFYKKIKFIGDDLLFKLFKNNISKKIEKERFSNIEFKKRLQMLTKENLNEDICKLIRKEKYEKALRKFYETN